MSNEPQFGFAIEYVKDIEAAKHFYVDVIGLHVERTFPTFVQFDHFAIAADQPLGGVEETELYWLVDNAESAYVRCRSRETSLCHCLSSPMAKSLASKVRPSGPVSCLSLPRIDRASRCEKADAAL
jgi:catechol 2,3-dioxygenase-like lactoylglutathione lyase family enzyme